MSESVTVSTFAEAGKSRILVNWNGEGCVFVGLCCCFSLPLLLRVSGGGLMGLMVDGARSAGQFQLYSSCGGDSVLAVKSLRRAFFLGRSLSGKSAMLCVGISIGMCDDLSLELSLRLLT